jgi:hypothetical protein
MTHDEYKKLPLKKRLELALQIELSTELRQYLLQEQWMQTRCYFARREDLQAHEIEQLANDDDHVIRLCIAKRQDLSPDQVAQFVNDKDPNVRHSISRSPLLDQAQREQLQQDEDPLVRKAAGKPAKEIKYRQRPGQAKLIR